MSAIIHTPSTLPKCPNHGETLEGFPFPMTSKGTAKCPVSGVDFDYEAEVDQIKNVVDKDGNVTKGSKWHLEGHEKIVQEVQAEHGGEIEDLLAKKTT